MAERKKTVQSTRRSNSAPKKGNNSRKTTAMPKKETAVPKRERSADQEKRIIRNRKESKIQEMKDSLSGRKSWSGWCLLCPF